MVLIVNIKNRLSIFRECPEEIKQNHPGASVVYARELLIFGEAEAVVPHCQELERDIAQLTDQRRKDWLAGELELVYMFTKYNDIFAMAEHVRRADELLLERSKLCDVLRSRRFDRKDELPGVIAVTWCVMGQQVRWLPGLYESAFAVEVTT